MKFSEVVEFNDNKLFNGSIDLDWYLSDNRFSKEVANSYVFHGNRFHAGNQDDIKNIGNNTLTDSVSLTEILLNAISSKKNNMLLGIAGYGAGKSHYSLMLSNLLNSDIETQNQILKNISFIDKSAEEKIRDKFQHDSRPVLVLPINGMRNCNLKDEFFRITKLALLKDNQPTNFLDQYDSKFQLLMSILVNHRDESLVLKILKKCGCSSLEDFQQEMDLYNIELFSKITSEMQKYDNFVDIPSYSNCELKDLIPLIYQNTCGCDKYYRSMLILFDEFGKYMMFAAENEVSAGSGIMQQLYEGINAYSNTSITLFGLSQLDLNEYQSTTIANNRNVENNQRRYVSRFDSAKRYYLSINFETLISNLIKINDEAYLPNIQNQKTYKDLVYSKKLLNSWFESSKKYYIWTNENKFLNNLVLGSWPLDIFSLWLLVYLSSINNVLQQRSSLNLLKECFINFSNIDVKPGFKISAVDFIDCGLGQEFINSEELSHSNMQPTIDYYSVLDRYGQKLSNNEKNVLKGIVISNKLHANIYDIDISNLLISKLTLLDIDEVKKSLNVLINEYNVVGIGLNNLYEINSNAPSYNEYLKSYNNKFQQYIGNLSNSERFLLINDLINSQKFESYKHQLFPMFETDFGQKNDIRTLEWRYKPEILITTNAENDFAQYLKGFKTPYVFSEPKGTLLFVIMKENTNIESFLENFKNQIENCREHNNRLPLIVVIVQDIDNVLSENAVKYAIYRNFTRDENEKYKVFIKKDLNKCLNGFKDGIDKSLKKRLLVCDLEENYTRRKDCANDLFAKIYNKIIPFPMKGFTQERGRGSADCKLLIKSLSARVDMSSLRDSLNTSQLNHCIEILDGWGFRKSNVFINNFSSVDNINEVFMKFDNLLEENNKIRFVSIYLTLIEPPYGLNSTGATLLAFLYYFGRQNTVELFLEDKKYNINNISNLKSTNFFSSTTKGLNIKFFDKFYIVKLKTDDAKWQRLIDDWRNATTYNELIEYNNKADELLQSNVAIPANCSRFYAMLFDNSKKAYSKIDSLEELKSKYNPIIDNLLERQSIYQLSKNLSEYKSRFNEIVDEPEKWSEESISDYEEYSVYFKNYLINNYDQWLEKNSLFNGIDVQNKIIKYKYIITNFDNLGFDSFSTRTKELLNEYNEYSEAYYDYKDTIELYNRTILPINRYYESDQILNIDYAKRYLNELSQVFEKLESFPVEKLNILHRTFDKEKSLINSLKNSIDNLINNMKARLEDIYNCNEIKDVNDLNNLSERALTIKIFFNDNADCEDINYLLGEIDGIKRFNDYIKKDFVSYEDLEIKLVEYIKKMSEKFDDPILDDESIIGDVYKKYIEDLYEKSHEYTQSIIASANKVEFANECKSLLDKIKYLPDYVIQNDKELLETYKEKLEEIISKDKIRYIISLINDLNLHERNSLIEQLN